MACVRASVQTAPLSTVRRTVWRGHFPNALCCASALVACSASRPAGMAYRRHLSNLGCEASSGGSAFDICVVRPGSFYNAVGGCARWRLRVCFQRPLWLALRCFMCVAPLQWQARALLMSRILLGSVRLGAASRETSFRCGGQRVVCRVRSPAKCSDDRCPRLLPPSPSGTESSLKQPEPPARRPLPASRALTADPAIAYAGGWSVGWARRRPHAGPASRISMLGLVSLTCDESAGRC